MLSYFRTGLLFYIIKLIFLIHYVTESPVPSINNANIKIGCYIIAI
jgi:hypothetical protein